VTGSQSVDARLTSEISELRAQDQWLLARMEAKGTRNQ
jgi:hypothetical protein